MSTLERFIKVYKKTTDNNSVGNIELETRLFEDLGLDSLKKIMLAIELEEEFAVEFTIGETIYITVGDVIKYIDDNIKKCN
ncbi:MAG: hypothetical protein KBT27_12530 [Prevotellaceae bacterium]|nr:hypothetical protein [Candidatus Faecinaster equi]